MELVILKGKVRDKRNFEVLSAEAITEDGHTIPVTELLQEKDVNEKILNGEYDLDGAIKKAFNLPITLDATKTPLWSRDTATFLLPKEDIDIETAINCGFGVAKAIDGEHEGKYFLFSSLYDNIDYKYPEDEMLMFDVYLQIVKSNYYNRDLEYYFNMPIGEEAVRIFSNRSDQLLVKQLKQAFEKARKRTLIKYTDSCCLFIKERVTNLHHIPKSSSYSVIKDDPDRYILVKVLGTYEVEKIAYDDMFDLLNKYKTDDEVEKEWRDRGGR